VNVQRELVNTQHSRDAATQAGRQIDTHYISTNFTRILHCSLRDWLHDEVPNLHLRNGFSVIAKLSQGVPAVEFERGWKVVHVGPQNSQGFERAHVEVHPVIGLDVLRQGENSS